MNIKKNEKNNDKKNTYNLENLFHKYDSYCCPYCTNLPEILNYNEGNGMIKFKCKKHGENNICIDDYLENIKKYVSISEINTKNKCSKHRNELFTNYCLTCQEHICQKCLKESKIHENHIKYNIESLRPNNNEILVIKNKISIYLQEKTELMKKLKNIEDKIIFLDTLINTFERQKPNFFLNINIKHLLNGEHINLDEIVKDFKQKSGLLDSEMKKELYEDFIKNNFLAATEGMNKLNLMNQNLGNEIMIEIMNGIEKSNIFKILKFAGKISTPNKVISMKDIKYLNLRGNKLSNIDFLLNKNLNSLEILSLNDNEIASIEILKNLKFPLLKELYLSKNKINSIDPLIDIKTTKLQILWISENNISNIDALEKVNFPQLRKLGLNKNQIKNINIFKKVKFPQLFELYLNDNEFDPDEFYEIIESLSFKIREFYYS